MKRSSSSPRRRRRLAVALVAAFALALPASAAEAGPVTWDMPATPAKWSAPDGSDNGAAVADAERSSWT